MVKRFLGICRDDSIEGEDIGIWGVIKSTPSPREARALGVKDDEMVGEVGGGRNKGLEVECMEGLPSEKVSVGYACFQKVAKALEGQ